MPKKSPPRAASKSRNAPRLAFFFGAGAEAGYGMPVGGRFALEILRAENPKDDFKRERKRIAETCSAAYRRWLPANFANASVTGVGKPEQNRVFADSMHNGYADVMTALEAYDKSAMLFLKRVGLDEKQIARAFAKLSDGMTFGETPNRNATFNNGQPARILESKYFSAIVSLARSGTQQAAMTALARATLQFYLGAHGQGTLEAMTMNPLLNVPEDNPAFAELGQQLRMNPVDAGIAAFKAVMAHPAEQSKVTEETFFSSLATAVLEATVEQFLDYRRMMDHLLPALYRPKDQWGKFTKIVQFLMNTRTYVLEKQEGALGEKHGYYHDLADSITAGKIEATVVGTSNYTSLCRHALHPAFTSPIIALNGSLDEYLDPYKNEIIDAADVESVPRFVVPFLFTQSGVKPLTSVQVSSRYVQYFEKVVESDAVVVAGFGFRGDDGHINALFRQAIDEHDKHIVVLQHARDASLEEADAQAIIAERLRIDKIGNLTVLRVEDNRTVEDRPWLDAVLSL